MVREGFLEEEASEITGMSMCLSDRQRAPPALKNATPDFPGGAVLKNPPANAGDTGSIPARGRSHMPRSS